MQPKHKRIAIWVSIALAFAAVCVYLFLGLGLIVYMGSELQARLTDCAALPTAPAETPIATQPTPAPLYAHARPAPYMGLQADTWEENVYSEDERFLHAERHHSGYMDSCTIRNCTYNAQGFLLETLWLDHDGKLRSREEYTRREDGRPLQRIYQYEDGSIEQKRWEYDENGNEIRCILSGALEEIEKSHKEYDENGCLIRSIYIDKTDIDKFEVSTFEYNPIEDWEIEVWSWDGGEEWEKCVYERDSEGRVTRATYFSRDAAGEEFMTEYAVHAYNKQGNEILYACYTANGELFIQKESIYDADGQTLLKTTYHEIEDNYRITNLYENGNIMRSTTEWDGGMWEHIHMYNADGNEILVAEFRDGVLSVLTTRTYHSSGVSSVWLYYDENGELRSAEREEQDSEGRTLRRIRYENPA
ncbi:MAG: hypothetical protein FWF10_02450 [Clostridiales bacterium]|nr:hypothetical protein [Clostridiales bacterium]